MKCRASAAKHRETTLLVVDARVDAIEILSRHFSEEMRVLMIDGSVDALTAIREDCARHGPVDTLALLAHAVPGKVELGLEPLTVKSLDRRTADLAGLRDHILPGGQIWVFACRIGDLDDGLILTLAEHTGREVAASSSLVAVGQRGASRDLDVRAGT